jgi:hypothetical protein
MRPDPGHRSAQDQRPGCRAGSPAPRCAPQRGHYTRRTPRHWPMPPRAAARTPPRRLATGPRPGCASTSSPGTSPAAIRPAGSPLGAPTWTTPSPTTSTERRARATSAADADATTSSNNTPDGSSNKTSQAGSSGLHLAGGPTPSARTATPCRHRRRTGGTPSRYAVQRTGDRCYGYRGHLLGQHRVCWRSGGLARRGGTHGVAGSSV